MYIGNDLQIAHPSYKIIDDISSGFNGSQTSFALQVNGETPVPFPISTQQVMISVNGVVQEPDPNGSAGFKLLGSNIVFSSAPANGHAFFGVINAGADYVTAGSEFPDGSATAPSFTFQDDQDTGWYRNASGDVGYSSNGTAILNFDGNGLTIAAGKGLTVDTSTLKVDATNNRVGIGSASPTETLHVYQNAADNVNALFEQGTTNSGNLIQFKQTTTGSVARTAYIGHGGDNTGQLMIQNSHNIYLQTGGSNTALTIDSSQNATFAGSVTSASLTVDTNTLHVDATNNRVGIGLTNPNKALHVKSTGGILKLETTATTGSNYIDFNDADENKAFIGLGSGSDDSLSIWNIKSDSVRIATNNLERMRIDSSGRLLVGVTASRAVNSAQGSFQIEGTGAEDSDMSIIRNQASAGGPALCFGKSRNASLGGNTVVNDDDQLGALIFTGNDGTDLASQGARIDAYVDGTPGSNDMPGRLVFSTTADGAASSTERMRIDSAGMIGINMTPHTSAGSSYMLQISSGGTQCFMSLGNNTSGVGPNNGVVIGNDGGNAYLWNREATPMQLGTSDLVRFQIGAAGQLGVGGATYGTSGQVLTSGGASAAPSWTTISSAPQITATANGSITANEAIIVESDGKVAGITGVSASLGTEQEYYNGRVRQHMCAFDSTTGKSVHVYANDGNQNQLYARVGTISGTGISYGSVVAVSNTGDSNLTYEYGCSVACGNGKVVVVLADSSGGGNISARAGTISGTSISFGSAVTLQSGPTNSSTDICYDSDKDKFIVLLSNNNTGNQCESQILTLSGTSISSVDSGRVVSNSGDDACFINVVYVPEKTAYFAVYCDSTGEEPRTSHAGAGLAKGVVGTINGAGNQLTWGSASTLGSDNKNNLSIAYVPSIEKVAMVYLDRYSQYRLESLVVAVDWTNKTMSIGNYSVIESTGNSDYQPIVACLNDTEPKIVVAYKHSPGLVNNIGTVNTSNNTISYAGRQTLDSGGDIRVGSAWGKRVYPKIASGKFMLSAVDYSANKTWSLIQQFAATDLTTQNFIGFASAGYSNGNTATINIAGNTTTQSSLTPGKKYYVQQDGSLSLTADTPSVVAGTALTSTSLLINPGR